MHTRCTAIATCCLALLVANVAAAQNVKQEIKLTRQAKSGVDSSLANAGWWNKDCKSLSGTVTFITQPKNGKAWAIEATYPIPPSTPVSGNTRSCAGNMVTGHKIMYHSNAGFHGTDTVVYKSIGPARTVHTTVTISVP